MSMLAFSRLISNAVPKTQVRHVRLYPGRTDTPFKREYPEGTEFGQPWNEKTRRTGVLGVKLGMFPVWDDHGVRHVITAVHIPKCEVIQQKTMERDGYCALQVGIGEKKPKRVKKPQQGHFVKASLESGVPLAFKQKVGEFRVTPNAMLPVGTEILATHFVAGQYVDVCGTSKGKGFQGGMKRWGFAGGAASHGNSKAHRSIGSTGQCQDPGKVFKGKKMPGHMGHERVTMQNLRVYEVNTEHNCLLIIGGIPGWNNGYVRITDAIRMPEQFSEPPPFPTFVPQEGIELPEKLTMPLPASNPLHNWDKGAV